MVNVGATPTVWQHNQVTGNQLTLRRLEVEKCRLLLT
jgi:hypothetical protein